MGHTLPTGRKVKGLVLLYLVDQSVWKWHGLAVRLTWWTHGSKVSCLMKGLYWKVDGFLLLNSHLPRLCCIGAGRSWSGLGAPAKGWIWRRELVWDCWMDWRTASLTRVEAVLLWSFLWKRLWLCKGIPDGICASMGIYSWAEGWAGFLWSHWAAGTLIDGSCSCH